MQIANKNATNLEMEIIDFQSDLQLNTRISQTDIWILVDEKKYPLLKETFQRLRNWFNLPLRKWFFNNELAKIKVQIQDN